MQLLPKSKFTWILVIFLAYAYYSDYKGKRIEEPKKAEPAEMSDNFRQKAEPVVKAEPEPEPAEEKFSDKLIDKIQQNDTAKAVLSALVKKAAEEQYGKDDVKIIAARTTGNLSIVDIIRGAGAELRCGATAVINYDAFMASGIEFDSTKAKDARVPISVQPGQMQVIKGLEAGIVGMREGGRRKISIPPGMGFNVPGFENSVLSKDETILYDVELVSIKDGPYKNGFVVEVRNEIEGKGKKILCGDGVKVIYHVKNMDSTPVSEGEASFKIGAGSVPMGFEQAVIDMKTGGRKIGVFPSKLLAVNGKSVLPKEIPVIEDQPLQFDIEVIESDVN